MRRLLVVLAFLAAACETPGGVASPTPPPSPSPLPAVELKYRVFDQVGRPWYCDPDFYPIARADETDLARQRLLDMQKDMDLFEAILRHNTLVPGAALTDQQLLAVYHDWKDLQRLSLEPAGTAYRFSELVRPAAGGKQGDKVEGQVDATGRVSVARRTPGGFLNCPICLAASTRIDTPRGPIAVTDLQVGDVVWTLDASRRRVSAPILATGSTPAPEGHRVLHIALGDGRIVTASPGHPSSDGRALGTLAVGDVLDGAPIISIERLPYVGRTYDLRPAGPTGAYWADGVALGSTLRHE